LPGAFCAGPFPTKRKGFFSMARDLYHDIVADELIPYTLVTDDTPIVSSIIDTLGYDSVTLCVHTHTLSDANATITSLVEDGDVSNLSDNGAVPDENLIGTEAGMGLQYDDDAKVTKIAYRPRKRYVRLTLTPSGNTGNIPVSGMVILGHPRTGSKTTQTN
jgi:hypothetical protein